MRILWTLIKVAVGLAIAIPLGVVLLGLTLGVVGTVVALAFMMLRLACVALLAYGVYRLGKFFYDSGRPARTTVRELPARDPYYDAAMRELDAEMGTRHVG